MSKQDIKHRIIRLMQYKGITASVFADTIGEQRSSISHILAGRNKPSLDLLEKIALTYPDISIDWLVTGLGKLEKGGTIIQDTPKPMGTLFNQDNETPPTNEITNVTNPKPDIITDKEPIVPKPTETKIATEPSSNSEHKLDPQPIADPFIPYNSKNAVERVIVFYKNGSFKQYLPEQE